MKRVVLVGALKVHVLWKGSLSTNYVTDCLRLICCVFAICVWKKKQQTFRTLFCAVHKKLIWCNWVKYISRCSFWRNYFTISRKCRDKQVCIQHCCQQHFEPICSLFIAWEIWDFCSFFRNSHEPLQCMAICYKGRCRVYSELRSSRSNTLPSTENNFPCTNPSRKAEATMSLWEMLCYLDFGTTGGRVSVKAGNLRRLTTINHN